MGNASSLKESTSGDSGSMKDPYAILGVSRAATAAEIRRAYHRLALLTHPDKLPPSADAASRASSEERFKLVNSAYEKLERTGTNVTVEGELVGLLKFNDHKSKISTNQCIERLDRIIELLPRHIEFMTSHSDDIIDMREFGVMCGNIYNRQYKLVHPDSFNFDSLPSNKSIIENETKLLHHLKIIADLLRDSKKQYLPWGEYKWRDIYEFLAGTLHMMTYVTLSPHADQLNENYHEISPYLMTRYGHYHEWGPTMRCIRWYIETLTKIIGMIQTNTLAPEYEANLDKYILVPGCSLFGISNTDPMTTLLQLVTNAEELLRSKMSLIEIDWISRRQTLSSLTPATRHASTPNLANAAKEENAAKANAAKALLISDPFITSEERAKMIANSGMRTSLVHKLVQQQPWPHPQTDLKGMISNRRSGGRKIKKTKRRHHRSCRK